MQTRAGRETPFTVRDWRKKRPSRHKPIKLMEINEFVNSIKQNKTNNHSLIKSLDSAACDYELPKVLHPRTYSYYNCRKFFNALTRSIKVSA